MKKFFLFFGLMTSQVAFAQWQESDYVKRYCQGQAYQSVAINVAVDCLTKKHAINYDHNNNWAQALGEALLQSAMTGKKAGIMLIADKQNDAENIQMLEQAIASHHLNVDVWTVNQAKVSIVKLTKEGELPSYVEKITTPVNESALVNVAKPIQAPLNSDYQLKKSTKKQTAKKVFASSPVFKSNNSKRNTASMKSLPSY